MSLIRDTCSVQCKVDYILYQATGFQKKPPEHLQKTCKETWRKSRATQAELDSDSQLRSSEFKDTLLP